MSTPSGTQPPAPLLACLSHSPLIAIRPRPPEAEAQIEAHLAACRAAVEAYRPDSIVMFGNNHYAGFHWSLMPPFCIGTAATAVADLGGYPGALPVPTEDALALLTAVRAAGFDAAVSYKMTVDHAFSQPLGRLFGGVGAYPVIPLFISTFTPPFLPFSRSRAFGEAVGRAIAATGKRVLIVGSGGLSHHPVRYFPLMGTAEPAVHAWQLDGARGGGLDEAAWFTRFDDLHHDGARAVLDGRRTAADMRLNPDFDRGFLDLVADGDLAAFDLCDQGALVENCGAGALELHCWIAAAAAYRAAGGADDLTTFYAPTPEYGIGYGMIYSP